LDLKAWEVQLKDDTRWLYFECFFHLAATESAIFFETDLELGSIFFFGKV
jgi:hypothetical protein